MVAVLGGWAFYGTILADRLNAAVNPKRVVFYALTLVFEWLLFVLVVLGVRQRGAPVRIVLGDRWHSLRQVLRDIGIAAAFWIVSSGALFVLGWLLRVGALGRKMDFILPNGGVEITLWVALSVTAGICEETVFRGYLQRQFIALTKNVPAGILLSAVAFGAAHAYQGLRMVILIRSVRGNVWDSGLLEGKRSPGNDRPCLAGFIERRSCQRNEALERA